MLYEDCAALHPLPETFLLISAPFVEGFHEIFFNDFMVD